MLAFECFSAILAATYLSAIAAFNRAANCGDLQLSPQRTVCVFGFPVR